MKRISLLVLGLLVFALMPLLASAQTPSAYFNIGSGRTPSLISRTGKVLVLGSQSTDGIQFNVAGTPVAVLNQTGLRFQTGSGAGQGQAVYVPTFAATPAAGTNDIKKGFNAIPTAAANTAGCLPAVPVVGDTFEGFNTGPNAVRVKACGTPGINGAAAGTYIPVAAATYFRCVANTATAYQCGTLAVPTPAGP